MLASNLSNFCAARFSEEGSGFSFTKVFISIANSEKKLSRILFLNHLYKYRGEGNKLSPLNKLWQAKAIRKNNKKKQ